MLHSLNFGEVSIFLQLILDIAMHWLRTSYSINIAVHSMVLLCGICMLMELFVLPGERHSDLYRVCIILHKIQ